MSTGHSSDVTLVQIDGFQFRTHFGGNHAEWMLDEPESAEVALEKGWCDAVAFGRHYIYRQSRSG